MLRRFFVLTLLAASAIPAFGQEAKKRKSLRVYFIGNSVTDTIKYPALAELAKARGYEQVWGRHMIPGAPLQWIWQHPKDGFQEKPFGHYPNALADFEWDVLSLQPFDRHLEGDEGDLTMAKNFIDLALPKSPDLQVCVYARWPRQGKDDFDTAWLKKYSGGWDGTNETKDYFERLTLELRKAYPKLKKPIHMVPVGHVMHELSQQMKAGQVPGYKDIKEVFADDIHLNDVGSYIVGCTYFATLYRENPKGLPGEPYKVTDKKLAEVIQEAVWKVVGTHELAGVAMANDPAAAIRSVLPDGWSILKVEQNTYPSYRPEGKGTAIFLVSRQHVGEKPLYDAVVYIMPADYQDGGEDPTHGQAQTYPAKLVATARMGKVYLWGNHGPFAAAGWHTLKDDILNALVSKSASAYEITTKKAQDRVEAEAKDTTTTLTISSPSGIGGATISPKEGQWPNKLILRLRLKGLESLTISNGKVTLGASVSSHGDQGQRVFLKEGSQETPVGKDDPNRIEIKLVGGAKVPLKDGYFEIVLPGALLKDAPQLTISWIDFYRG